MKFVTSTRALLLACFASAPLLGGADGGCSNDAVSIGGDGTDAGTGGKGGGGVPCGPTHCGAGLQCCNESCGICVAPGEGCPAVGCVDPCAAQGATGVGSCDAHFGYRWNGSTCESVSGCSCEGIACQGLFGDRAECESRHSNCDGGGQCAAQDRAVADYFAEHSACTTDADCQNVSIGCSELARDCAGSFYTNRDVDPATVAALQAALATCVTGDPGTGCAVCTLAPPPAACNAGVCGPLGAGGGTCSAQDQAFVSYLDANKACTENIDCRLVNAACTSAAVDCTGAAYANTNVDEATLTLLRSELDTCRGDPGCTVCTALSAPPACVEGTCAPSPSGWSCPPVADSCTDGCNPILARAYDPVAQCLSAELRTVGCTYDTGGTDDIVCVQRESDGALFMGVSGSPFRNAPFGWRNCPEATEAAVLGAPQCS